MTYDGIRTEVLDLPALRVAGHSVGPHRGFVWTSASGAPPTPAAPTAGGVIDGLTVGGQVGGGAGMQFFVRPRFGGMPHRVEAGAAFAADVDLEVQADGTFIEQSTGAVVAHALDAASGAGDLVWAVIA